MEKLQRGITYWDAYGGYTDEIGRVMYTVISKYEVPTFKENSKKSKPKCVYCFQGRLAGKRKLYIRKL